jgi:hypothetical protein
MLGFLLSRFRSRRDFDKFFSECLKMSLLGGFFLLPRPAGGSVVKRWSLRPQVVQRSARRNSLRAGVGGAWPGQFVPEGAPPTFPFAGLSPTLQALFRHDAGVHVRQ